MNNKVGLGNENICTALALSVCLYLSLSVSLSLSLSARYKIHSLWPSLSVSPSFLPSSYVGFAFQFLLVWIPGVASGKVEKVRIIMKYPNCGLVCKWNASETDYSLLHVLRCVLLCQGQWGGKGAVTADGGRGHAQRAADGHHQEKSDDLAGVGPMAGALRRHSDDVIGCCMQTYELNVLGHRHAVVSISYRRLLKIGLILGFSKVKFFSEGKFTVMWGRLLITWTTIITKKNLLFGHFRSGIAKSDVKCS